MPPETLSYAPPPKRLPIYLRLALTTLIISVLILALINLWTPIPPNYPIDGPVSQYFGIFNYLRIENSDLVVVHNRITNTWSEHYRTNLYHWHYPALATTTILTLLSLALTLFLLRRLHRYSVATQSPPPAAQIKEQNPL